MQCIFPPHELCSSFPQRLQADLAGNAFNGTDFLVELVALLVALSKSARFQRLLTDEPVQPIPQWFCNAMTAERVAQHLNLSHLADPIGSHAALF